MAASFARSLVGLADTICPEENGIRKCSFCGVVFAVSFSGWGYKPTCHCNFLIHDPECDLAVVARAAMGLDKI